MSLGGCMEKQEALEIIKKFVEGDLPIQQFKDCCKENLEFRNFISEQNNYMVEKKYDSNLLKMVDNMNWNNYSNQFKLQLAFAKILFDENINMARTNKYYQKAVEYADIVPDWLSDDAMEYVDENIIDKVPNDLSDKEKKKRIKKQIKETFKFEKQPPEFAQSGIWPQDEDGNFLVFRKQIKDGEKVTYVFVDPNTKQEYTFEEMF